MANGTVFTSILATLNHGASTDGGATTPITGCFVNHCDWRLPSIVELQWIVDPGATGRDSGSPCIVPAFGTTQSNFYWSATTRPSNLLTAWGVDFCYGSVIHAGKPDDGYVRAVRTGL